MIKVLVEERQVVVKALDKVKVYKTTCRDASENILKALISEYNKTKSNVKLTVYNRVKNYKRIYNFTHSFNESTNKTKQNKKHSVKYVPSDKIMLCKTREESKRDDISRNVRGFARAVKRGDISVTNSYIRNIDKLTE